MANSPWDKGKNEVESTKQKNKIRNINDWRTVFVANNNQFIVQHSPSFDMTQFRIQVDPNSVFVPNTLTKEELQMLHDRIGEILSDWS